MKLTPAQRKALQWISAREPVSAFTADGPSLRFVKKLIDLGLVESVGVEPGRWGFTKFATTDAGRSALSPSKQGEVA